MAGTLTNLKVTTSEKEIKVSQQGDRGPNRGVSVGPSGMSAEITAGPVSLSIGQDGTIGGKIGIGGLSVGADNKGGFTVETPLGGIDYNSDGSGTIKAPFGIAKVEVEKKGCTYILRTYVTGALIDTEVREIPDCQEPPPPPPPEPPPPPPVGLPPFIPFDPGSINIPNSAICLAFVSHSVYSSGGNSYEESISVSNVNYPISRRENNWESIDGLSFKTKTSGDFILKRIFPGYMGNAGYSTTDSYQWDKDTDLGSEDHRILSVMNLTANLASMQGPEYRSSQKQEGVTYSTLYDSPYLYECWIQHIFYTSIEKLKEYISRVQVSISGELSERRTIINKIELFTDFIPPIAGGGGGLTMGNCCKESKVDLARLEEKLDMLLQVTDAEPLTKKGYTIPASLIAFGSEKGQLEIKSIPAYLQYIMREIDHYGISPIKINIKDIDPTQEGDQGLAEQYVNGTAAIKRILELLHGQKGTDKLRLNLQARIASMLDMVLASVTAINELLESITVYIDMPLKEKIEKYKQPWDPYIGLKGFSQKQAWEKELNKKLKEDMEKNIADMCNDSERSVVVQKFNGKADRLVQLIQKLLIGMKH